MSLKTNSIDYIAEDAADILSDPLTLELRSMAHASEWPSSIISQMSIEYEDGALVVQYPEEADDLEYGDINSLPNAVIRPFILRAPSTIQKVIEREALGALFVEMGVV